MISIDSSAIFVAEALHATPTLLQRLQHGPGDVAAELQIPTAPPEEARGMARALTIKVVIVGCTGVEICHFIPFIRTGIHFWKA